MKRLIVICAFLLLLAFTAAAQTLTNETIQSRINSANAEKSIALTYDAAGKTTKVGGVSENFSRDEASRSGILAMNFAIGIFYPGNDLVKSPESFIISFWVLSKKPRFGASHSLTVALRDEMLVIGSARYTAKPREQMEYLNFEISRENLTKIAGQTDVRLHLGDEQFTFTRSQMKLFADLLQITEVGR
ncbi:MAG TPA: hypothetical protein VMZ26_09105 [Pyrinomonadaceae bacterium]|nr:hypothetical protein [Pyrinomonadaceae bacterium]